MTATRHLSRRRLEQILDKWVLESDQNQLTDYDGQKIFGSPFVGVADGDHDLFHTFQRVVDPRHLMPRRLLESSTDQKCDSVTVLAWALPYTAPIRQSNRDGQWPSQLYSLARNNAGALNHTIGRRLTRMFQESGIAAVVPGLTEGYDAFRSPDHTFSSTWSERHVAYAAGMGQFGLNGCLITRAGGAVRFGSIVTNLPLDPTVAKFDSFQAPCLKDGGSECGLCIPKCPENAISAQGLDKAKCYHQRQTVRRRFMDDYVRDLNMYSAPIVKSGIRKHGYSLGCALCVCGVPCEHNSPFTRQSKCSTSS